MADGLFDSTVTLDQYVTAFQETVLMIGVSLFIGGLIGIPLSVLLVITRKGGLRPNPYLYGVLNVIVNIIRSVPFVILMVSITPVTRFIVQTTIGTKAAIVPLTIFVAPFIARLIEGALLDVDPGIVEAAETLGASTTQIIWYFLLPEARGSIILALTTACVGLIGATAMAGTIGGGGIGDLAYTYGYQQFDTFTVLVTVVILIAIVQIIQTIGNTYASKGRH